MREWKNILIFGMGLMGGSLSLAIRKKIKTAKTTGVVRSEASKDVILKQNISDFVFLEEEFFQNRKFEEYDLVIFATPVHSVIHHIQNLNSHSQTIYTDLGSTKKTIIDAVHKKFSNESHRYVSSHPMCGSEHSGPGAAKENLYEEKLCIVTSPNGLQSGIADEIRMFWEAIGCWTLDMEAKEHDETLAYLSHLPHLVSSLLVQTAIGNPVVNKQVSEAPRPITGGGFRDMSRIAGSNLEMWLSIFQENQNQIYESLKNLKSELEQVTEAFHPSHPLDRDRITEFWKESLLSKEKIQKTHEIY
ncbi:prephenate dehydrogenase [Leptospira idonii]|uniref:Prephenate dehydrogenase/arogenate dehydrogenase family protein n=1 Tax=Leptospira idonii TaxID=1193500 RepID=A0A4V3JXQ0_9LEPT|nr:prephenate dehydrogenase/arogenate dehydrogenase family protein [Leptospira idonii]TGN17698.1 prephenate dehydrogenase/arogenate dehydrogenase family protein [Leptospira idonii]